MRILRTALLGILVLSAAPCAAQGADPSAEFLLAQLEDTAFVVQNRTLMALETMGTRAAPFVPALLRMLQDPREHVRFGAVTALQIVAARERVEIPLSAAPVLVASLADTNSDVRGRSMNVLGYLAPRLPEVRTRILRDAEHPDWRTRLSAFIALGNAREPAGIPVLARAVVADTNRAVRFNAINALARIDDPAAISALARAFEDPQPSLRENATLRMTEIGARAVPELRRGLAHANPSVRSSALTALAGMGSAAGDALADVLALASSADSATAALALSAIGRIMPGTGARARDMAPGLLSLLTDRRPHVRFGAATALNAVSLQGQLGADAIPTLLQALRDSIPYVRSSAVRMLHRAAPGDVRVRGAIEEVMRSDPSAGPRTVAAEALRGTVGAAEGAPAATHREPDVAARREITELTERLRLAAFLSDPGSTSEWQADVDVLERYLADDYVRVGSEGNFVGKPEVLASLQPDRATTAVALDSVRTFLFGEDLAVVAARVVRTSPRPQPPQFLARVLQRRAGGWKLIAEEIGPVVRPPLPEPVALPAVAPRNPALPHDAAAETELRRAVERYRTAVDAASQRDYGRVMDRAGMLASFDPEYVRILPDLSVQPRAELAAQFARIDRGELPIDAGHRGFEDPNAVLEYENVNVAVFGDAAVVTWRTVLNGNRRAPKQNVLRVYRRVNGEWLNVAGIH